MGDKEKRTRNWLYLTLFGLLFLAIIRLINNILSPYYGPLFFDAVQIFSILVFGVIGTFRKSSGLLITYLVSQLAWAIIVTILLFAWTTQTYKLYSPELTQNSDSQSNEAKFNNSDNNSENKIYDKDDKGISKFLITKISNSWINKLNRWMECVLLLCNLVACIASFVLAGLYLRIANYYEVIRCKSK